MKVKMTANVKYASGKQLGIGDVYDTDKCPAEVREVIDALVSTNSRAVLVIGAPVEEEALRHHVSGVTSEMERGLGSHKLGDNEEGEDADDSSDNAPDKRPLKKKG